MKRSLKVTVKCTGVGLHAESIRVGFEVAVTSRDNRQIDIVRVMRTQFWSCLGPDCYSLFMSPLSSKFRSVDIFWRSAGNHANRKKKIMSDTTELNRNIVWIGRWRSWKIFRVLFFFGRMIRIQLSDLSKSSWSVTISSGAGGMLESEGRIR